MNVDDLEKVTEQQWEGAKHRFLMWSRAKRDLRESQPSDRRWEEKRNQAALWRAKLDEYQQALKEAVSGGE